MLFKMAVLTTKSGIMCKSYRIMTPSRKKCHIAHFHVKIKICENQDGVEGLKFTEGVKK